MPIVGLNGYDAMSAQGENASIANSALTDTSVVVTVGRYGKAYAASDMARFTSPMGGVINPAMLAQDDGYKHPLHGTMYDTQADARRAAFEAGLLAVMVYEDPR